jgi:AraC-like DNA-binding protein
VPLAVRFAHSAPREARAHEAFFRAPIEFEAAEDALVLPRELLAQPMPKGDEEVSRFLSRVAEEQLSRIAGNGIVARVQRAMGEDLSVPLRVADMARRLGLSERTLRRHLAAQATTFEALYDDARATVARHLMTRPGVAVAEAAYLTGFSDVRAFHRAFRRWAGTTPGAFRARPARG